MMKLRQSVKRNYLMNLKLKCFSKCHFSIKLSFPNFYFKYFINIKLQIKMINRAWSLIWNIAKYIGDR